MTDRTYPREAEPAEPNVMARAGEKLSEVKETLREMYESAADQTQRHIVEPAKEVLQKGIEGVKSTARLADAAFLAMALPNTPTNDVYLKYMREHALEPTQTLDNGAPNDTQTASLRVGEYGPIMLADTRLLEALRSMDTERIPERLVHAVGAGAYGYFEVTNPDIQRYCRAKLFDAVGKRTPMFTRFSTVGPERGGSDLIRDLRGFAMKFYTEEGNWDLVGNNSPIFFINDPILFPAFTRVLKPNPVTGFKHGGRTDPTQFWDFMSLRPESTHQVCWVFGDRGIPDGYRNMDGFGTHTFKTVNSQGEAHYVKFHLLSNNGRDFLSDSEALRRAGIDSAYSRRDLWTAIDRGDFPSWTMFIQVMPLTDAGKYDFTFDPTKIWPHSLFPLIEVGRMTLDRNPTDYFAEVEQSSFQVADMVPGIEPSADLLLQGRLFSYSDAALHRLGRNNRNIPVNQPKVPVQNYTTDGFYAKAKRDEQPSYYPNGFHGPAVKERGWHMERIEGMMNRIDLSETRDNYSQARKLVMEVFDDAARERFIDNVAGNLIFAPDFIQERALRTIFEPVDKGVGDKIRQRMRTLNGMVSMPGTA